MFQILLAASAESVAKHVQTLVQICKSAHHCDERAWLTSDMTKGEAFLLQFPSINSLLAQLLLWKHTVEELIKMSSSDLEKNFPHIPPNVFKIFCLQKSKWKHLQQCSENSSQTSADTSVTSEKSFDSANNRTKSPLCSPPSPTLDPRDFKGTHMNTSGYAAAVSFKKMTAFDHRGTHINQSTASMKEVNIFESASMHDNQGAASSKEPASLVEKTLRQSICKPLKPWECGAALTDCTHKTFDPLQHDVPCDVHETSFENLSSVLHALEPDGRSLVPFEQKNNVFSSKRSDVVHTSDIDTAGRWIAFENVAKQRHECSEWMTYRSDPTTHLRCSEQESYNQSRPLLSGQSYEDKRLDHMLSLYGYASRKRAHDFHSDSYLHPQSPTLCAEHGSSQMNNFRQFENKFKSHWEMKQENDLDLAQVRLNPVISSRCKGNSLIPMAATTFPEFLQGYNDEQKSFNYERSNYQPEFKLLQRDCREIEAHDLEDEILAHASPGSWGTQEFRSSEGIAHHSFLWNDGRRIDMDDTLNKEYCNEIYRKPLGPIEENLLLSKSEQFARLSSADFRDKDETFRGHTSDPSLQTFRDALNKPRASSASSLEKTKSHYELTSGRTTRQTPQFSHFENNGNNPLAQQHSTINVAEQINNRNSPFHTKEHNLIPQHSLSDIEILDSTNEKVHFPVSRTLKRKIQEAANGPTQRPPELSMFADSFRNSLKVKRPL
ncbi:uncharacterized protein LOC106011964 [Aplysia californica]|uniref:Uncharacterized protein LOC106011964 n=1 Tax=Aplysia californica TaxID=6500 RepID=A0ABM1A1B9_APLCA|nr:uncharacterized protein LOC106011964 [Aplysia californica]